MENINIFSDRYKPIIGEAVKSAQSVDCEDDDYLVVETANLFNQKSPETESKRNKVRSSCTNLAKSREVVEIPLPAEHLKNDHNLELEVNDNDDINENCLSEIELQECESLLDDLWEFDDNLIPEQRKKITKKTKPEKSQTKQLNELNNAKKKELIKRITNGDVYKLIRLLHKLVTKQSPEIYPNFCELINTKVDDHSNTLLHIAALKEQTSVLEFFLSCDANPCLKNKYQQTAYTCTKSIKVREILRQYARNNPDKFDYDSAKIPIDPDTKKNIANMRKDMRKILREKEKEQEIKKKEEKGALAAKRRITQSGKVKGRCISCEDKIAEKVRVEYNMQHLFCSMQCLKVHRIQNPILWSK